jgi:DNA polymerase-3 subunit alpha
VAEKAALGFYITGHPLDIYLDLLQSVKAAKSVELVSMTSGSKVSIGGIISDLQIRTTKKGDKFALLRLEDEAGGTKCVVWPEAYRRFSTALQNEAAVLITGRLELAEDSPPTVITDQVQSLESILKNNEFIVVSLDLREAQDNLFDSILQVLNTYPGQCDVAFEGRLENEIVVRIKANSALRVTRCQRLDAALTELGCAVRAERMQNGH